MKANFLYFRAYSEAKYRSRLSRIFIILMGTIFLLELSSCAPVKTRAGSKRNSNSGYTSSRSKFKIDRGFRGGEIEQFFLVRPPSWSRFSQFGGCFFKSEQSFMAFDKINTAYDLDYSQFIHFQALFNQSVSQEIDSAKPISYKKGRKSEKIGNAPEYPGVANSGFRDEQFSPEKKTSIFFNSLDQVSGGVKSFNIQDFEDIHILLLDGLEPSKIASYVAKYMSSPFADAAPTLLFSLCHETQTLKKFLASQGNDPDSFPILGAEALSVYNLDQKNLPIFHVNFGQLLGKGKNVILFTPSRKWLDSPSWKEFFGINRVNLFSF